MKITKDKVVSLAYELKLDDANGEVVEQVQKQNPFVFLYGAGNVLEEFETNLEGKQVGDTFEFTLESEQAYGDKDENAVVDIPKEVFMVEGQMADHLLHEGNVVAMQDQNGNPLRGKIINIQDNTVTMDFNHPMAGKNLHFKGEVVNVREATNDEIDHGHVHGEGGVHHH